MARTSTEAQGRRACRRDVRSASRGSRHQWSRLWRRGSAAVAAGADARRAWRRGRHPLDPSHRRVLRGRRPRRSRRDPRPGPLRARRTRDRFGWSNPQGVGARHVDQLRVSSERAGPDLRSTRGSADDRVVDSQRALRRSHPRGRVAAHGPPRDRYDDELEPRREELDRSSSCSRRPPRGGSERPRHEPLSNGRVATRARCAPRSGCATTSSSGSRSGACTSRRIMHRSCGALARLAALRPTLAIAGDGPLRGSLEALAARVADRSTDPISRSSNRCSGPAPRRRRTRAVVRVGRVTERHPRSDGGRGSGGCDRGGRCARARSLGRDGLSSYRRTTRGALAEAMRFLMTLPVATRQSPGRAGTRSRGTRTLARRDAHGLVRHPRTLRCGAPSAHARGRRDLR